MPSRLKAEAAWPVLCGRDSGNTVLSGPVIMNARGDATHGSTHIKVKIEISSSKPEIEGSLGSERFGQSRKSERRAIVVCCMIE